MATIKSYTDINQSKKLAEILPLESSDMHTIVEDVVDEDTGDIISIELTKLGAPMSFDFPCWSLAALLSILPIIKGYRVEIRYINKGYCCCYTEENHDGDLYWYYADNPVDACVAMIEKLHELNLL